jgi:hypothetical protein
MVLVVLGQNPVNFGDGWVPYDPIALTPGNVYTVQFLVVTSALDLVYSRFAFRYFYPTVVSPNSRSLAVAETTPDLSDQFFDMLISPNLPPGTPTIMEILRIPIYSQPSNLADVEIILGIDPDVFYTP